MINWLEGFMNRKSLKRCVNYCRYINDKNDGHSSINQFSNFQRPGLSFKSVSGLDKDRKAILDWIKDSDSSEKRILSNVSVLNEGFDASVLDCLVINDRKESFINIV
jgi:predicted helicase